MKNSGKNLSLKAKIGVVLALTFTLSAALFFLTAAKHIRNGGAFYLAFSPKNISAEPRSYTFEDEYQKIALEVFSSKTTIKPSTDGLTRVNYITTFSSDFKVEIKNQTLVVEERSKVFIFDFGFNRAKESEIIVEIPEKRYEEIKCKIVSDYFHTDNIALEADYIELNSVSGEINVSVGACDRYKIDCVSGEVKVNGLSGEGVIGSLSSEINATYSEWNGDLSIKVTSGDVKVNLPSGSGVRINSSVVSGEIKYDLDGNKGVIENVNGGVFGDFGEGNVHEVAIEALSGNVKLGNE